MVDYMRNGHHLETAVSKINSQLWKWKQENMVVKNNELGNHTLGSKYSLCHAIYVPCEDYMYKVLEKKKKPDSQYGLKKRI